MESTILTMGLNAAYQGFKDGVNENDIKKYRDDELPNHELQVLDSWDTLIKSYGISTLVKNNISLLDLCKNKGVEKPKVLILKKDVNNVFQSGIHAIGSLLQGKTVLYRNFINCTTIKMGHVAIAGLDDKLINLLVSRKPLTYTRALDILAGQGYEVVWFKNYEGSIVNAGATVSANVIVVKA